MKWKKLLNPKRIREIMGGKQSEEDSRTPFERDYGRAVFSTPVRRLQDKTQVFPLEEHDAVRTRLTHSLEVSSVARNLARRAGDWIAKETKEISSKQVNDIETIAATCGLIHDLGNPPFGHAGESAIQSWFESKIGTEDSRAAEGLFAGFNDRKDEKFISQYANDFLKWEGNAQTLRLISKLQVVADNFGLNLTAATFSAARKYIARSNEVVKKGDHEKSKPGFFASENRTVKLVEEETGTQSLRNPITYLVEACDDMVYATGDVEDGIKKGLLDWKFLKNELLTFSKKDTLVKKAIKEAENTVKFNPNERPVRNEEVAQAFRTHSIALMTDAAFKQFCRCYDDLMRGRYHKELIKDPSCGAAELVKACKTVGQVYIYPSSSTLKLELMGRRVIHDLMDVFWEGAKVCGTDEGQKGFPGKAASLISSNYRRIYNEEPKIPFGALGMKGLPERYCRLQLVTDQIAGMTDSFAITLHQRLMNG